MMKVEETGTLVCSCLHDSAFLAAYPTLFSLMGRSFLLQGWRFFCWDDSLVFTERCYFFLLAVGLFFVDDTEKKNTTNPHLNSISKFCFLIAIIRCCAAELDFGSTWILKFKRI